MKKPNKILYASLEEQLGKLEWINKEEALKNLIEEDNLRKINGILVPQDFSDSLGKLVPFHAYIRALFTKKEIESKKLEDPEGARKIIEKYLIEKYPDDFFYMGLNTFSEGKKILGWGKYDIFMGVSLVNPRIKLSYNELANEIAFLNRKQVFKIWDMPHRDPTICYHM